jgi:leucyl-tRNA synthetase
MNSTQEKIISQYNPKKIETEVQDYWEKNSTFLATEDPKKEKFYCLAMFPYPSGKLHMGHVRNYTITDVIARYQRMKGKNVLHPMGWDAFGLPAENAAIQNNTAPANWTYQNIDYMRKQLKSLGFGFDWSRELSTCQPSYYKWEQWFFTRLYKKGLVYKKMSTVNWDPVDCTVLANEQVIDGRGWRSGVLIERKEIPQWFIKITSYAEELLKDLNELKEWPEQVKTMQKNWIGKSKGAEIKFNLNSKIDGHENIQIFTTRPDTLLGVSYLCLAPDHPISLKLSKSNKKIKDFISKFRNTSVAEADITTLEKEGVNTDLFAIHPINGEEIPIWIANYVLMNYGSGAVMAVPAHDERDFYFAKKYNLPIKQVIKSLNEDEKFDPNIWHEWYARKNDIVSINSEKFDNLSFESAFKEITTSLINSGNGKIKTQYRLRDWGVSRQRYWGTPIPILNLPDGQEIPVPEDRLPVILPEDVDMDGVRSPIKSDLKWCETEYQGKSAQHETDTFDTFMESSWYYARFTCPDYLDGILDKNRANYWLPVDQYVGGIEHAILHLLYARFFHKLLRDEGYISSNEPFKKLLCQGMVLAESFYKKNNDGSKTWLNPSEVNINKDDNGKVISATEKETGADIEIGGMTKMSKSKNNGVDPQITVDKYGADTVRVFTMFTAPPEQTLEWNDDGVAGSQKFLRKLWIYFHENEEFIKEGKLLFDKNHSINYDNLNTEQKKIRRLIHINLKQANNDYERSQFNTVVAACMKILNELPSKKYPEVIYEGITILIKLLSPIAPHICQKLWGNLCDNPNSNVLSENWPIIDENALSLDEVEIIIQVNGKLRAKIILQTNSNQEFVEENALSNQNVAKFANKDNIQKVIFVPNKLINFVTK